MTIEYLRNEVVKRGIEAAKQSYSHPDQAHKLRGSLDGFNRAKMLSLHPEIFEAEIALLEDQLRVIRNTPDADNPNEYWELRCFLAEIQWTFDVLLVAWRDTFPGIYQKMARVRGGFAMKLYSEIINSSR